VIIIIYLVFLKEKCMSHVNKRSNFKSKYHKDIKEDAENLHSTFLSVKFENVTRHKVLASNPVHVEGVINPLLMRNCCCQIYNNDRNRTDIFQFLFFAIFFLLLLLLNI
jgi:predicted nucleic acid-binding Zn ribbon protein